jgi:beta-1,2-mannobiose phosphorylase / 1,2-beta-oligomannan phosphorylase
MKLTLTNSPSMPTVGWPRALRLSDEPILQPGDAVGYGALFNSGLIHHNGKFHLFVRGIRDGYRRNPDHANHGGPRFLDYVSDVLLFTSEDGAKYCFDSVLLRSEGDVYAIEDPRVQLVTSGGIEHLVMTYTRLPHVGSGRPWQIGAHRLVLAPTDNRLVVDPSTETILGPARLPDKDAVVFNLSDGRVVFMHRIHPDMQIAVFDHLDDLWNADDRYWDQHLDELHQHVIIRPTPGSLGVGAGAPPLACDLGLLLFFHERRADGVYTMNVALLDAETGRTRAMLPVSIMEPELPWECVGDVDQVVFVQGVHRLDHDTIYLVYGAADRCVGAAVISERELLDAFTLLCA